MTKRISRLKIVVSVTTLEVYMYMYSKNCSGRNGHEMCFYIWLRKTKPIEARKIHILRN